MLSKADHVSKSVENLPVANIYLIVFIAYGAFLD